MKPLLFSRGAHFRGDYCDSLPLRSTRRQKENRKCAIRTSLKKEKGAPCNFYAIFSDKRDLDLSIPFTETRFGSGPRKTDIKSSRRNLSLGSISDLICKYRTFLAIII